LSSILRDKQDAEKNNRPKRQDVENKNPQLIDLDVDLRIILKWTRNKYGMRVRSSCILNTGDRPVVGIQEHDNGSPCSIKGWDS
jgi:hypothetical protein